VIDPKTIGTYLGLIAGFYLLLSGLLVLVAVPIGGVVLIIRAIKKVLKKKGSYERRDEPSAPEFVEQVKKLISRG
jgi:hypothetical protein